MPKEAGQETDPEALPENLFYQEVKGWNEGSCVSANEHWQDQLRFLQVD